MKTLIRYRILDVLIFIGLAYAIWNFWGLTFGV